MKINIFKLLQNLIDCPEFLKKLIRVVNPSGKFLFYFIIHVKNEM